MGISVLMSVYSREKPEYFNRALTSITVEQTRKPDEIVLVKDGPLGAPLESVISKHLSGSMGDKFHIVELKQNQGLGRALEAGLKKCSNNLVARMDSDDIAMPERLMIEEEYLIHHPIVTAVGGDIEEFRHENVILRIKHMPTESAQLYQYGKYRNPLNHMTVMFTKEDIEKAGGYRRFPLLEDYHLWIRLLVKGYKIANIPTIFAKARLSDDFVQKRGGKDYFLQYRKLRSLQYKCGYTNKAEYVIGLLMTFIMTVQPNKLREVLYKQLRFIK